MQYVRLLPTRSLLQLYNSLSDRRTTAIFFFYVVTGQRCYNQFYVHNQVYLGIFIYIYIQSPCRSDERVFLL